MITPQQAIDQINKANPFFGQFLNCDTPLKKYCKENLTSHKFNSIHLERQKPYVKLIKEKIDKLFPNEDVNVNYSEGMICDTSAHHNLINFPAIIGTHTLSRFDTILEREKLGDYYVLDTSNVTLSEVLHKRGVEFAGKHLNLFPKKDKNVLVAKYPLYKFDLMDWINKSGNQYTKEQIDFIKRLQEIIDKIDFSTCERFADQIVKINYYLWLEFFDPKIRDKARRCITLEHDEILIKYLKSFLLENKDNFVWKALFDENWREVVLKEFDKVYGAWNYSGPDTGTYFFWAIDKDGKRYRLELQDNKLIEKRGNIREVDLTPEDIVKALNEGIITPSIFTKFSLVNCYMGAKVMGGPGQTDYVPKVKEAWIRVLEKLDPKEKELVEKVSVYNMNGADIAFHREKDGKLFREWGFDLAMNHTFTEEYLEKLGKMPFKYAVLPFTPLSYYRLTPAEERQKIDCNEQDLYKGYEWVK